MTQNRNGEIRIEQGESGHIQLKFSYDRSTIERIRTLPGSRWNGDRKVWVVPLERETLALLRNFFKKRISYSAPLEFKELQIALKIRNYSLKTARSYIYYNRYLLLFSGKSQEQITEKEIHRFLFHLSETRKVSGSTLSVAISALQFHYGKLLKKPWGFQIERPRKEKKLPSILSKKEVYELIHSPRTLKHKLLLAIIYSSGLRVSEAVQMEIRDIDFDRKLLFIRSGKGKKDRYTLLSDVCADMIKHYVAVENPDRWLFSGQQGDRHLSVRSAEKIFELAIEKCRIRKQASIHSLRHAFATHLIESGTDIRFIQQLLGHASIRTTQIYTHVAIRDIRRIKSPLDNP